MIVHLDLAPETEQVLKERAAQIGLSLEAYLVAVAEREARSDDVVPTDRRNDAEGFEQGLDELSEGLSSLPPLPADFSRADIYGEHG